MTFTDPAYITARAKTKTFTLSYLCNVPAEHADLIAEAAKIFCLPIIALPPAPDIYAPRTGYVRVFYEGAYRSRGAFWRKFQKLVDARTMLAKAETKRRQDELSRLCC